MTQKEALRIENGFVDFDDRVERTNAFRGILNCLGFAVTYQQAELILDAINIMDGEEAYGSIRDISELQALWHENWEEYFKEKEEKK